LTGGHSSCGESTSDGGSVPNEALALQSPGWSLQCFESEFFHKHFFVPDFFYYEMFNPKWLKKKNEEGSENQDVDFNELKVRFG